MSISLTYLMTHDGFECSCGKRHYSPLKDCFIGEGVISKLPEIINSYGCTYPYLLCDSLTYAAAGEKAVKLLENNRIKYAIHEITRLHPASDEKIVGEALMFCPNECDIIIAVGGGVINDTCKIIAAAKKFPIFSSRPHLLWTDLLQRHHLWSAADLSGRLIQNVPSVS